MTFTPGVDPTTLAARYPILYHMAALGSWPSIQRHGLLSTSGLLDLYAVRNGTRVAIEAEHRPNAVQISSVIHGTAVIRDQKPMDDAGLRRALQGGLTPTEWYRILNSKVFFWVTSDRLNTLLSAGTYRNSYHDVLLLDTASVLSAHGPKILLAGMNTGATKPMPFPRGRDTFLPLDKFPYSERLKTKKKSDTVVEFAVEGGIGDAVVHTLKVFKAKSGERSELTWER